MQVHNGLNKNSSLAKSALGWHPIIEHFVEMFRMGEIISIGVRSDKRMRVGNHAVLTLLVHNILPTPNALYDMEDWFKPLDLEKVGLTPHECRLIQDDRIGRALASFYESRHGDVCFRLALKAITVFYLDCSRIDCDTTSVTCAGKYYPGWSARGFLTRGHNKDQCPDVKQLLLRLSLTADGAVPLAHRIYWGNQTADRLHPATHRALQKLPQRVAFVYVADYKLATEENFCKISSWCGLFVSVMPQTWREDTQFCANVPRGQIKWKHIVLRKNNRNSDSTVDRG